MKRNDRYLRNPAGVDVKRSLREATLGVPVGGREAAIRPFICPRAPRNSLLRQPRFAHAGGHDSCAKQERRLAGAF